MDPNSSRVRSLRSATKTTVRGLCAGAVRAGVLQGFLTGALLTHDNPVLQDTSIHVVPQNGNWEPCITIEIQKSGQARGRMSRSGSFSQAFLAPPILVLQRRRTMQQMGLGSLYTLHVVAQDSHG